MEKLITLLFLVSCATAPRTVVPTKVKLNGRLDNYKYFIDNKNFDHTFKNELSKASYRFLKGLWKAF